VAVAASVDVATDSIVAVGTEPGVADGDRPELEVGEATAASTAVGEIAVVALGRAETGVGVELASRETRVPPSATAEGSSDGDAAKAQSAPATRIVNATATPPRPARDRRPGSSRGGSDNDHPGRRNQPRGAPATKRAICRTSDRAAAGCLDRTAGVRVSSTSKAVAVHLPETSSIHR
jgi:hypothetical protein